MYKFSHAVKALEGLVQSGYLRFKAYTCMYCHMVFSVVELTEVPEDKTSLFMRDNLMNVEWNQEAFYCPSCGESL